MERQALHASYISFTHPVTGKKMDLFADLLDDMVNAGREIGFDMSKINIELIRG